MNRWRNPNIVSFSRALPDFTAGRRTPGGSAAAVGAGMVPAALGTQTQASTLRPASFCGAVGFKPAMNDRKFNPAAIPPRRAEAPGAGMQEGPDCA